MAHRFVRSSGRNAPVSGRSLHAGSIDEVKKAPVPAAERTRRWPPPRRVRREDDAARLRAELQRQREVRRAGRASPARGRRRRADAWRPASRCRKGSGSRWRAGQRAGAGSAARRGVPTPSRRSAGPGGRGARRPRERNALMPSISRSSSAPRPRAGSLPRARATALTKLGRACARRQQLIPTCSPEERAPSRGRGPRDRSPRATRTGTAAAVRSVKRRRSSASGPGRSAQQNRAQVQAVFGGRSAARRAPRAGPGAPDRRDAGGPPRGRRSPSPTSTSGRGCVGREATTTRNSIGVPFSEESGRRSRSSRSTHWARLLGHRVEVRAYAAWRPRAFRAASRALCWKSEMTWTSRFGCRAPSSARNAFAGHAGEIRVGQQPGDAPATRSRTKARSRARTPGCPGPALPAPGGPPRRRP